MALGSSSNNSVTSTNTSSGSNGASQSRQQKTQVDLQQSTYSQPTASSSQSPSVGPSGASSSGAMCNTPTNPRPGSMVRVPELSQSSGSSGSSTGGTAGSRHAGHSRNSSWDLRVSYNGNGRNSQWAPGHSRTASLDMMRHHSRNSSVDLNKYVRNDLGLVFGPGQSSGWSDPMRVQIIKAHHNWILVAYAHFVTCYRLKDYCGWQQIFISPYVEQTIERIAINAKMSLATSAGEQSHSKMVAISYGSQIRLWGISEDGSKCDVGTFNLHVRVEYLFFIGSQLVALSSSGKIGVWHAMTQHWQIQDLVPILSFDTAGSFLLLGCNNGSIYYIGNMFSYF